MKRNRHLGIIICVGFLLSTLAGCNDLRDMVRDTDYFEITVADNTTKEPITDVLFLGYWDLHDVHGLHGQTVVGIAQAIEGLTNIEGKIRVPHPQSIPDDVQGGYLGFGDPTFVLYKEGYKEHRYKNIGTSFRKAKSTIEEYLNDEGNFNEEGFAIYSGYAAYWHGRTIYLDRHSPDLTANVFDKPNEPDGLERGFRHVQRSWVENQGSLKKQLPITLNILYQYYKRRVYKPEQ